MNSDLSPLRGTRPLRVVYFGDGPRTFMGVNELINGVQDENPRNVEFLLGAGHTKIMTHHYFEPVGWVGDFSLPSKSKDKRCTRFGALPFTAQMPRMLLDDAKVDWPNLTIPRWEQPIQEKLEGKRILRQDFLAWFKACRPDICLMSTYATLIPMELIQLVNGWFINFHPTRMNCCWPEFGGCTPWEDMFWAGVKKVVVVAYFIDDKFDRGQFITESEARDRIRIRGVQPNGQLLEASDTDAHPSLIDAHYQAILRDPSIRTKGEAMPGFSNLQQMMYLFDNHIQMAEPTAKLVHSLAPVIWSVMRQQQIPADMSQLDYFQNLFPKRAI